tara:strand:+ start:386 stop:838 length:453 start_codon:yes stop_codon:yes gene_type:complete
MIQFNQPVSPEFNVVNNTVYLDLYDKFDTSLAEYSTLWIITSQFTKKTKAWVTSTIWANKERYVEMNTVTTYAPNSELNNRIILGTTDYPLGFYDVTIYQNTSNTNTDPSGLNVLYTGLMNCTVNSAYNPVQYTEYTTNDSDTESVYTTF